MSKAEVAVPEATVEPAMRIPEPDAVLVSIPIVGTSPLLVHRFSEKAKKQMLDATQGIKRIKEPKDPEAEYLASLYTLKGDDSKYGFPCTGFKSATVSAARLYGKNVTMVALRQALFFQGAPGDDGQQMAVIDGTPEMREDVCRVGNGGTDLRYRAMFPEWSTVLHVVHIRSMVDTESVLSLVNAGGLAVGVGDWRPEKSGTFGTFRVDSTRNVEVQS